MGDLTENIFLNTTAADKAEDEELSAFLHYVNAQTTSAVRWFKGPLPKENK